MWASIIQIKHWSITHPFMKSHLSREDGHPCIHVREEPERLKRVRDEARETLSLLTDENCEHKDEKKNRPEGIQNPSEERPCPRTTIHRPALPEQLREPQGSEKRSADAG
jgi:hypothetical protein